MCKIEISREVNVIRVQRQDAGCRLDLVTESVAMLACGGACYPSADMEIRHGT